VTQEPSILLGVNVDHVATIRQARGTRYPDPVVAALVAEQSGADSITIHVREDRRHIQERDLELLQEVAQTRVNLEMAATSSMLKIAARVRPADCCLVPERRAELTTEGGLDVARQRKKMRSACTRLGQSGIRVSLFVDPDKKQLDASRDVGATVVEIHTGAYAEAATQRLRERELKRIRDACAYAQELGLRVHAGHGLNYRNVQAIAAIQNVRELNIGHAIVAQALFDGFAGAVSRMKGLMLAARNA
jgi:pyridoxine 5-phosphate synthase